MNRKDERYLLKRLRGWKKRPWDFVADVFPGFTPVEWQDKLLHALPDNLRITIRSGHGVGKSTIIAIIILWFLVTHYPCKIPCTAPSSTQLRDVLWAEIAKWKDKMIPALANQIEMNSEQVWVKGLRATSVAMARTARKERPEAFQGIHSKNVLFLVDEASGIDEKIFEAGEGALSTEGARLILIGNPTRTSGTFYRSHHQDRHNFFCMHVSCVEAPHVSRKFIEEMKRKYGEYSDIYRYRVLGEFPKGSLQSVISLEYLESAVNREVETNPADDIIWGVDVARQGKDRSALSKRQGNRKLEHTKWWQHPDTMLVAGEIISEYRQAIALLQTTGIEHRPRKINIDCIGYGAGVSDRMREVFKEEGWDKFTEIVDVSVAMNCTTDEAARDYWRLRDQLWFASRDWFQGKMFGEVSIPDEPDFIAEMSSVQYKPHSSGKLIVASKEEMKEELDGLSPDLGDSWNLTLYVPPATPEVRLRIL